MTFQSDTFFRNGKEADRKKNYSKKNTFNAYLNTLKDVIWVNWRTFQL